MPDFFFTGKSNEVEDCTFTDFINAKKNRLGCCIIFKYGIYKKKCDASFVYAFLSEKKQAPGYIHKAVDIVYVNVLFCF